MWPAQGFQFCQARQLQHASSVSGKPALMLALPIPANGGGRATSQAHTFLPPPLEKILSRHRYLFSDSDEGTELV